MSIGKRVRQVREQRGLTHHEFSKRLHEKENRIKSVEYEKQRAPGELLAKIVDEFHVNALWLLTGRMTMLESGSIHEAATAYCSEQSIPMDNRQARLTTFMQYWVDEKQDEDHIWLEGQLRRFVPDYADFISDQSK